MKHISEFTIDETIQEAMDTVGIVISVLENDGGIELALTNLRQTQHYLECIRAKVKSTEKDN